MDKVLYIGRKILHNFLYFQKKRKKTISTPTNGSLVAQQWNNIMKVWLHRLLVLEAVVIIIPNYKCAFYLQSKWFWNVRLTRPDGNDIIDCPVFRRFENPANEWEIWLLSGEILRSCKLHVEPPKQFKQGFVQISLVFSPIFQLKFSFSSFSSSSQHHVHMIFFPWESWRILKVDLSTGSTSIVSKLESQNQSLRFKNQQ